MEGHGRWIAGGGAFAFAFGRREWVGQGAGGAGGRGGGEEGAVDTEGAGGLGGWGREWKWEWEGFERVVVFVAGLLAGSLALKAEPLRRGSGG